MLKKYGVWVSILSSIFMCILAFVKLKKDVPSDISFVVTEWGLLLLFIVPPVICIFKGE